MPLASKPSEVQVSLSAKTELELTRLQFENNLKKGRMFSYTPPTFQKGRWVCWYVTDLLNDPDFEEFRV